MNAMKYPLSRSPPLCKHLLDYTRDVTVKQKVGNPSLIARFAHIFIVIVISFGRTDLVSISCLLIWFIQNIC